MGRRNSPFYTREHSRGSLRRRIVTNWVSLYASVSSTTAIHHAPQNVKKRGILTRIAVLAASCILVHTSSAQSAYTEHTIRLDEGGTQPDARISDVAWLAGHWRGEGLGGVVDESWTPPLGSTMAGTFMLTNADSLVLYEMMALVEVNGSVVLWVKHFNPDFTGWEDKSDKVSFPLVRLAPDALYFSGLTFKRINADSMNVFLAMGNGGKVREARLAYRRRR